MDRRFDAYRQDMDSLHYTQEQKAQLTSVAVHTAEQEQKYVARTKKPLRRTVLITAAVVAVLVCTACATGALKSAIEVFAPLFGNSTEQTEVIDSIGTPIGVSDTDNGVTITADAIIGDKYNVCIAYTISWDDNASVKLPENDIQTTADVRQPVPKTFLLFEKEICDFDWTSGWSSSSWFSDDDPTDNEIQFYQTICGNDVLQLETITSSFENLQYCDVSTDQERTFYPIVDGDWELSFDAGHTDSSITFDEKQSFEKDDIDVTVTSVSVSPIGVYVEMMAYSENLRTYDQRLRCVENMPLILTKTDGTTINLTLTETGFATSSWDDRTISGILKEIVPLDEMRSITIGDVEYQIPHN